MNIVYFAWVRERIGQPTEVLDVEEGSTVSDAITALSARSPAHELAFSDREVLRFALDQVLVDAKTPLNGAKELAIFPPMTGG